MTITHQNVRYDVVENADGDYILQSHQPGMVDLIILEGAYSLRNEAILLCGFNTVETDYNEDDVRDYIHDNMEEFITFKLKSGDYGIAQP